MKSILVPTDFSKVAINAFDFAVELAQKIEAKIILFHAVHETHDAITIAGQTFSHGPSPSSKARYIGIIGERMNNMSIGAGNIHITTLITIGNIKDGILEAVDKHQVDMVVMGSKGAVGIKELFIGSHTEEIIRHTKSPVITIKEPTRLDDITNIMYATDISPESEGTLLKIIEIQKLLNLKLILLRVNRDVILKTRMETIKELEQYAMSHELQDYAVESVNAQFVEWGILEAAEKFNAGFIAMGTHGRKGIEHMIGGSYAENVANHTHRPLISYQYEDVLPSASS